MVKNINKRKKKVSKPSYKKTEFTQFKNHGITSHKFVVHDNSHHINSNILLSNFEDFCKTTLRNINTHDGMNVCIESPKCCKGYARFNIDRGVPICQYFGKVSKDVKNNTQKISTYGVGSGSSTVGGDTFTNRTREMPLFFEDMCKELTSYIEHFNKINNNEISTTNFNHVTLLYYLNDKETRKNIILKKHTDIAVTAGNKVLENNSQFPGTPTVVLSLYEPKYVKFFKRYSDGKSFENDSKETSKMIMNHGEFFFLHPHDERVLNREVLGGDNRNTYTKEKLASQFQHGVKCDWSKNDTRDKKYLFHYALGW